MTDRSDTPRMDPQCLGASLQQPGCAANRYKERIAELERELATAQAELDQSCNAEELRQVRAELVQSQQEAGQTKPWNGSDGWPDPAQEAGMVLVPRDDVEAWVCAAEQDGEIAAADRYRAMLAAAPDAEPKP